MAWMKCDSCNGDTYTDDNPFVEMRIPRPSDRACMTCVMAGHWKCFHPHEKAPPEGGVLMTEDYTAGGSLMPPLWEKWIESKAARKAGFLFLD